MTGKAHQVMGVATAAAVCLKFPQMADTILGCDILIPAAVLAASPGSFMPDIDHEASHYGRKVKVVSKHLKHRGFMHSLIVPFLCVIGAIFLKSVLPVSIVSVVLSLIYGFVIGYLTHIAADMFNGSGVPLLMPLTQKKFHILDLDSSGWQCVFFTIFWLGGLLVLCLIG